MEKDLQPGYIRARTALLDALVGLGPHRESVIPVGAQAIYVRTDENRFPVSPFTYDADLAIDPAKLRDEPPITDAMLQAGFSKTENPGIYKKPDGSQVDLFVPAAVGGSGKSRRGAQLGAHGSKAARNVLGLEGALVDNSLMVLSALAQGDDRRLTIRVAGPAALFVSKIIKVAERTSSDPRRQDNKDSFDIYRLLDAVETNKLASDLRNLFANPISAKVTATAISKFKELFSDTAGYGTKQVVGHVEGLEDPDITSASCIALSNDLIRAIWSA